MARDLAPSGFRFVFPSMSSPGYPRLRGPVAHKPRVIIQRVSLADSRLILEILDPGNILSFMKLGEKATLDENFFAQTEKKACILEKQMYITHALYRQIKEEQP
jgi:hypothetical protein